jgi:hypothetical protein
METRYLSECNLQNQLKVPVLVVLGLNKLSPQVKTTDNPLDSDNLNFDNK